MFRKLSGHLLRCSSQVRRLSAQQRQRHEGAVNGRSGRLLIAAGAGTATTLYLHYRSRQPHLSGGFLPEVQAKSRAQKDENSKANEEEKDESSEKIGKPGFRERKIIEYENRIRQYSTPDKVFRYFASIKVQFENGEVEIFMTPQDFLRSITPGIMQPQGYGLDRYKKIDAKNISSKTNPCISPNYSAFPAPFQGMSENSVFYRLSASGLISFSDYIFLLTILSASKRHFEIAFRMIDLNGDGDIDYEEFEKVQAIIRNQTSIGSRHRDHQGTGNIYKGVSSALCTFFFGEDLDQKLTVDRFLEFQRELQTEILTLEFLRHDPKDGKIPEWEFAELLTTYAGLSDKRKNKMMKRIEKHFKDRSEGITLFDYLQFFHLLNNITEVDTALTFYHIAGASIDPPTLKHVAQTVAHVELRDHVVDVLFALFDENMDGQLSNKEFVSVMKERLHRGLEKPKDTGFVKLLSSFAKCAIPKKATATVTDLAT
ncbi:calcium uptake protein 1 homolog, mitochondrial [Galendromus occidentalis]|uniref:Calcium uptake protein 1 homolog, mitochondrial n=1 Tax=Galendromus occidentalis TaxID=34638 RepID=A0AAJ7P9H1_9ACAR|nr:calcium uptake protein 1 homolog, mitochondrial [Galendromus occidentalis]